MCGPPPKDWAKRRRYMVRDSIHATVEQFANAPGGQILASARGAIQRSLKYYLALFTLGFVCGFPLSSDLISWLTDKDRLPAGVDIIVLSPVEFLFLQIRVASYLGLAFVCAMVVAQVTLYGVNHAAVKRRLQEMEIELPKPGPRLVLALSASLLLMAIGALYAWYGLIPLLLEYLTTDAQQANLSTKWSLSNYAGFIVNLLCASAIGFQAPLVTTILLRSGAITRQQMAASRRIIWFGAFVVGAFMSPPDPLSLFLVAMPIILLFEAALAVDGLR
ncbi:MAG TPA: hypothetical protein D7I13_05225 [Candidatus Poseidoniales archaeon]|nr:MAG TPA: hypothetical protein D7I13_05225 [Candidatus Poseidoniales archaeon]